MVYDPAWELTAKFRSHRLERRRNMLIIGPVLACLATSISALGQNRASLSRPSDQTGSSILGRTGGQFTREIGNGLAPTQGMSTQAALQNGGNLNQQNFLGAARGLGGLGSPPLPQAFSITGVGFSSQMFNYPVDQYVAPPSSAMLASLSGLSVSSAGASGIGYALSNSMPLLGVRPRYVDISPQPYFIPKPQESAFDRFFELRPSESNAASAPAAYEIGEVPTVAKLIERGNDQRLIERRQRALAEFAEATSDVVDDRAEALSRAQNSLRAVMQMDRTDYVAPLLLVHVALAKNQSLMAANCLDQVLKRHPEFFIDRPDVAAYFGDYQPPPAEVEPSEDPGTWGSSRMLTEQVRGLIRLGGNVPANSGVMTLQAYCAWILNDDRRVRSTLARMAPDDAKEDERGQMQRLSYAMGAALR